MSKIPIPASPNDSFHSGSLRPRRTGQNSSVSPATDRSVSSISSPRSQILAVPKIQTPENVKNGKEDPKSDSAMLAVPRSRKDLSRSPATSSKSRIAKPVSPRPVDTGKFAAPGVEKRSPEFSNVSKIPGVMYISENLIYKITKAEYLHQVTELNLNLGGSKKIKFMEKLDDLYNLKKLDLSNNMVEKISGLGKLKKLEVLVLSNNSIMQVGDSFEHLGMLRELNLSHNKISGLSKTFGKGLICLQSFDLSHNDISNIKSITALENLSSITSLNLKANPFCETSQFWESYITYKIPTLSVLNGQELRDEDRQKAHERFGKIETDKLSNELRKTSDALKAEQALEIEFRQYNEKLRAENQRLSELREENKRKLAELQKQSEESGQLLARKSKEVSKLVDKNYELEQELAFFKIDKKFGVSGSISDLTAPDNSDLSEDMPYVGKATSMKPKKRPKQLQFPDTEKDKSKDSSKPRRDQDEPDFYKESNETPTPRTPTVRFQDVEEKISKSEQQMSLAQANLADAERDVEDPQYFRGKQLPEFADKLYPHYLPGPKTGYQGFRENQGEIPWQADESFKRQATLPASAYSMSREKEILGNSKLPRKFNFDEQRNVSESHNEPGTKTEPDQSEVFTSPKDKDTNSKPLLDDAIVKYRSLQNELDEMLKLVRAETQTVIGLEKQLNIQPPAENRTEFDNLSLPMINRPPFNQFAPQDPTLWASNLQIPAPMFTSPEFDALDLLGPMNRNGDHMVRSQPAVSRSDAVNGAKMTGELLKTELESMASTVCNHMEKLRKEIEYLKRLNRKLENNLTETSEKEKNTKQKIEKIGEHYKEMQSFLTSMSPVFEDIRKLEGENQRLQEKLEIFPSLEDIWKWKHDSDQLEAAGSVIEQLKYNVEVLQNQSNAQSEIEQKLRKAIQSQNERMNKLQQDVQVSAAERAKAEASRNSELDKLEKLQNSYDNLLKTSIKPDDLMFQLQKLTKDLSGSWDNSEDIQTRNQDDICGRVLKDFQMALRKRISELKSKIDQAEVTHHDLNKKIDQQKLKTDETVKLVQSTKREYQERRETDKKEIESKIKQWKKEISMMKATSEQERAGFFSQLKNSERKREKLQEKVYILERELMINDSEFIQSKDLQQREKTRLDNQVVSLKDNEGALQKKISQLEKELREIRLSRENQKRELESMQSEMEQEINGFMEEKSKLVDQVSTLKDVQHKLQLKLTKTQSESRQLFEVNQELQESLTGLKRELETSELTHSLTDKNKETFFQLEIENLNRMISSQENNLRNVCQELNAVKEQMLICQTQLRGEYQTSQMAKETIKKEFEEKIVYLEDKLESAQLLVESSEEQLGRIEQLDSQIEEKEKKLQLLEENERKQEEKARRVEKNWQDFKFVLQQHDERGEIGEFLEGKTTNFIFFEKIKRVLDAYKERKAGVKELDGEISMRNQQLIEIKKKTDELMTEYSSSKSKKEKTEEQLQLMKQLLAASQFQVEEFNKMSGFYR